MVSIPGAALPFPDIMVPGRSASRAHRPFLRRIAGTLAPGMLVAVGYMDPGNWATDIAAGSAFGFDLLFVLVAAGLAAIVLQSLALRLGIASGLDLAQACRRRYGTGANVTLWLLAELAILATDVAEVLGSALAIKLLLGFPLWAGIVLTAGDTLIVLGLEGRGFRRMEAIVAALVGTIALCFLIELLIVPPDGAALAAGLAPDLSRLAQPGALALAVGIVGATVMPHNLYLHSSIVQGATLPVGEAGKRRAICDANKGSIMALLLAMMVNGAILALGAGAFHMTGHAQVGGIEDAYRLLSPITGTAAAGLFFGIALLASGQSSTFTGTLAGQVVLEGFLVMRMPLWQRRLITRLIALVPAMTGVLLLGEHAVGSMLVVSQMVLSLQLPFAIWPLIRANRDPAIMKGLRASRFHAAFAWLILAAILIADLWLVCDVSIGVFQSR